MNRKLFIGLPLVFLLAGCAILNPSKKTDPSSSGEPSSNSGSSSESQTSSSSSSSSSQGGGGGGNTKVFNFTGTSFTTGTGVAEHLTELKDYMNNGETIVSSLNASSCSFGKFHQEDTPTTLQIGSSSYGGYFTINFAFNISRITFVIQGYSKYYSGAWHPDSGSYIEVAGHTYNVGGTDTSAELEPKTESLDVNTNTLTFSNDEGAKRVFLHSLTIQYA